MQNGTGAEIFTQVTVEGGERMGGRQSFFEQQAHRVAFVTEGRLHADQYVAELLAQHKQRTSIAQLAPGCRSPLRLDFLEPALALDMVVGGDQRVDIGVGAVLGRIAMQNSVAQFVDTLGHVDLVALSLHPCQRVHQRFKDREIGRAADIAGIGRKVEQNNGDFALVAGASLEGNQFAHARSQHQRPFGAGGHVLRIVGRFEGAGMVAACTGHAGRPGSSAKDDRSRGPVELRDRDHDGAFDREQPTV